MFFINLVPRTFSLAWGRGRQAREKVLGTRLCFYVLLNPKGPVLLAFAYSSSVVRTGPNYICSGRTVVIRKLVFFSDIREQWASWRYVISGVCWFIGDVAVGWSGYTSDSNNWLTVTGQSLLINIWILFVRTTQSFRSRLWEERRWSQGKLNVHIIPIRSKVQVWKQVKAVWNLIRALGVN